MLIAQPWWQPSIEAERDSHAIFERFFRRYTTRWVWRRAGLTALFICCATSPPHHSVRRAKSTARYLHPLSQFSHHWNTLPTCPPCSLDGSVPALSPATGSHWISLRSPESGGEELLPGLSGTCESVQGRGGCVCVHMTVRVCVG